MGAFLSYDEDLDWLEVAPYGVVMDRQGSDRWRGVTDQFGYFLDTPGGSAVGFKVVDLATFDPEAPEVVEIFSGQRFDVPALALTAASAGEIVLAARALLGGRSTVDRRFFAAAMNSEGEEALAYWLAALQAGNAMAHYGAGYTLLDLGRLHEAYRHLRHYTELVNADPWAWAYRARAAAGLGEIAEAISCCQAAIEREDAYDEETDADELLESLRS